MKHVIMLESRHDQPGIFTDSRFRFQVRASCSCGWYTKWSTAHRVTNVAISHLDKVGQ